VFGVEPDRFDHQVKFIGAVDFARPTVGLARHELVGFAQVKQPIDTLGVAVNKHEHLSRARYSFGESKTKRLALKLNMMEGTGRLCSPAVSRRQKNLARADFYRM
jgi:hypothetical protein